MSSYAAPHTPIASTKRTRGSTKVAVQSPLKHQQLNKKPVIPAPQGALFSPALSAGDDSVSTGESTETPDEDDHEEYYQTGDDDFNPYQFIGGLPPYQSAAIKGKICLPQSLKEFPITLTLDLDETLVHCSVEPIANPDIIFPVSFNGASYQVYVRKRPYLDHFLETVAKSFEVVLFTASQRVYADKLLNLIDPEKKLIQHRLFREACLLVQGNYIKDLNVLGRDLKKTVLVDNSPHAYGFQLDNGIPIESWFDDETDTELLKLAEFLKKIVDIGDVRPIVREHFKSYTLVDKAKQGLPIKMRAPPF
jgi:CTD small phosphatase-like protein 2